MLVSSPVDALAFACSDRAKETPVTAEGPDLTLEQVKQAGLFAWNENRYLYAEGRLLRVRPHADGTVEVSDSEDRSGNLFIRRGWHHVPGCRCSFCLIPAPRRLVVLNVDDDEAGRYVLSRSLRAAGMTVLEAGGGIQALELATPAIDLVLLDINMPDLDGFEVCRALKADPDRAHIPIVFVTATAVDPESERVGMQAGAHAFLTQPVEPQRLLQLIDRLAGGVPARPSTAPGPPAPR
jgi:CheY-like chemotaxis protein